ncbi:MAG: hypothetical protein U0271_47055 [Polyangiaceae bacterium]
MRNQFQGHIEAGRLVRVEVETHAPGVLLPPHLAANPTTALDYGPNHRLTRPIPDLLVTDEGISATLSFNGEPFKTMIPWSAVRRMAPFPDPAPPPPPKRCVFCSRTQHEVVYLIDGDLGAGCEVCIPSALAVIQGQPKGKGFIYLLDAIHQIISGLAPTAPIQESTALLRAALVLDPSPAHLRKLSELATQVGNDGVIVEIVSAIPMSDRRPQDHQALLWSLFSIHRAEDARRLAASAAPLADDAWLASYRAFLHAAVGDVAQAGSALAHAELLVARPGQQASRTTALDQPPGVGELLAATRMMVSLVLRNFDSAVSQFAHLELARPAWSRLAGDVRAAAGARADAVEFWKQGLEKAHPESPVAASLRERLART